MQRINSRTELAELTTTLGVRPDWHEPDNQGVTAVVVGNVLDNTGGPWPAEPDAPGREMHVILQRSDVNNPLAAPQIVGAVNLSYLLAWAAGTDQPFTDEHVEHLAWALWCEGLAIRTDAGLGKARAEWDAAAEDSNAPMNDDSPRWRRAHCFIRARDLLNMVFVPAYRRRWYPTST